MLEAQSVVFHTDPRRANLIHTTLNSDDANDDELESRDCRQSQKSQASVTKDSVTAKNPRGRIQAKPSFRELGGPSLVRSSSQKPLFESGNLSATTAERSASLGTVRACLRSGAPSRRALLCTVASGSRSRSDCVD
eukprot:1194795-Prorocentrum_minimum.AAC.2